MAKAKAESGKLRAESDHGEGANFQRSTANSEGETEAAWANQANAERGARIAERRVNEEFKQVGRSVFAKELRRDTRDARKRKIEAGERKFVEALMKFTAGAKRSREPEMAVAARRWEGKIHFHVRVTLQRKRKA